MGLRIRARNQAYGTPLIRVAPKSLLRAMIVIIALGQSIVAIGGGAAGLALYADVVVTALLGVAVTAALWWTYFDWVADVPRFR
jgi:Bacterial low temperature requirement A protein (LtrA)